MVRIAIMIEPEPHPHLPGYYHLKDALGEVIYVGKARDMETLWKRCVFRALRCLRCISEDLLRGADQHAGGEAGVARGGA